MLRLAWQTLRPPRVRLIYGPVYERHTAGIPVDPLRATRILAFLANEGLVRREAVVLPHAAALKNLLLVHDAAYLESLQRPEVLTQILGTPVDEDELESLLDVQRLMVGGTIQATRLALASGFVAVNLGGGFHHASGSRGSGFCAFNDVAVAISRLRQRGFHRRILVVDLDLHDGNGTRAIFAGDPSVHTFSVHNRHWGDTAGVETTSLALGDTVGDEVYLGTLVKSLPPLFQRFAPGLVVYVAGCDVAAGDHLGTWSISADGILARDRLVVELARGRGIPLAVVMGGGYGEEAWRPAARFLAWLMSGTVMEPPDNEALTLVRFGQLRAHLDTEAITRSENGDGWQLTEDDLVGILPGIPRQTRFLGYFSRVGLELMLEECGLMAQLRGRGFKAPTLRLELDHTLGQTLRLFGDRDCLELLVELRVARSSLAVKGLEVLVLEWMLLQDPRQTFPPARRPLPGQRHPGLGLLHEFSAWLVVMCEILKLDGIVFHPSHYHVAAVSRRIARFLLPEHEARFRVLQDLVSPLPLAEATLAVHSSRVLDVDTGTPLEWHAHSMVVPVSERFRAMVLGSPFEEAVANALGKWPLRLRLAADPPADNLPAVRPKLPAPIDR